MTVKLIQLVLADVTKITRRHFFCSRLGLNDPSTDVYRAHQALDSYCSI